MVTAGREITGHMEVAWYDFGYTKMFPFVPNTYGAGKCLINKLSAINPNKHRFCFHARVINNWRSDTIVYNEEWFNLSTMEYQLYNHFGVKKRSKTALRSQSAYDESPVDHLRSALSDRLWMSQLIIRQYECYQLRYSI